MSYQWLYDAVKASCIRPVTLELSRKAGLLTPSFQAILRYGRCRDRMVWGSLGRRKTKDSPVARIDFYLGFHHRSELDYVGEVITVALQDAGFPLVCLGALIWEGAGKNWKPFFQAFTADGMAEFLES